MDKINCLWLVSYIALVIVGLGMNAPYLVIMTIIPFLMMLFYLITKES